MTAFSEPHTLVDRLRGIYRIPITDGLGPVDGSAEPDNSNEFVAEFETTPICHEAANEIERLNAVVDELKLWLEEERIKTGVVKVEAIC